MNKKFIRLLGSALITLTLTGCGKTATSYSRFSPVEAESMYLNQYNVALIAGNSKQIVPTVLPNSARGQQITFTSNDTGIATVDAEGNVKGVKGGITSVTVKCNDVEIVVPVYVGDTATKAKFSSEVTKQAAAQTAIGTVTKFQTRENRNTAYYVDDEVQKGKSENSLYTVSDDDGLIYLDCFENAIKATNANAEPTKYAWGFYTDSDYFTNLYHVNGGVKNRVTVPTQNYIGSPRINAAYDAINCLFTKGKEQIVDNNRKTCLNTEELNNSVSYADEYSTFSDGENSVIVYSYAQSGRDTIDAETEPNIEIPAGTSVTIRVNVSECFVNGVCVQESLTYDMSYRINGVSWTRKMRLVYDNKVNNDVTVEIPDNKDFNQVKDIFEL